MKTIHLCLLAAAGMIATGTTQAADDAEDRKSTRLNSSH